ncbi:MAG: phospholipid/cholesterol/gamma-HCH transport system permease protein [Solirubrobacteraceae bacterium]|jgi:phospholipid/cholesterol/gamma-HCH transport system permease protein|nr:phospholipid/cholesterol/gamma-HCH transport system permease protein [Solirubrobacteraceae bacterium]
MSIAEKSDEETGYVDGPFTAAFREAGELAAFCGRAVLALRGTPRYGSEVMRQASYLVSRTTTFMFFLAMFLGISVSNFGYFFLRSIGGSDALGIVSGFVDPRLATPIIFGYAFTSKVCCGIVAEIGSMKVQQETEALESTGIDPMHYIVGTRVLATLTFIPLAAFVCLIGTTFGGWLGPAVILKGISSEVFFSLHWGVQTVANQVNALVTIAVIGTVTTLIACFYGFRATAGPASVGAAAARSLLVNLILVHVIYGIFAVLFYGTDISLPIGG